MSLRTLIAAACTLLPVTLNAAQVLSAPVEEVVASEAEGYRASAYIVRWQTLSRNRIMSPERIFPISGSAPMLRAIEQWRFWSIQLQRT